MWHMTTCLQEKWMLGTYKRDVPGEAIKDRWYAKEDCLAGSKNIFLENVLNMFQ